MKSNYNRIPKINWIEEQTNKQQVKVDQTYTQTNQTVTTKLEQHTQKAHLLRAGGKFKDTCQNLL